MRVLVTGGTGRVGRRLVPRLIANGHEVRVLVRSAERATAMLAGGAEVALGDLGDRHAVVAAVKGVEAVVHLAAAFRGTSPAETRTVNVELSAALGRAALDAGTTRFVFSSTNLVYGPGRGRPARESDPPGHLAHAYPASKAAAEEELGALYRRAGLGLRVLRLAFVYGDGDPHLAESLEWMREWPAHKRLHMVHHADVAQAVERVLRAPCVDGCVYNVADDAPVTAAELYALNGSALPPAATRRLLDDPWDGIVDTAAIRADLGLRPVYPTVYTAAAAGAL